MNNFAIACNKSEVKEKIKGLMTIQERLALDAGLVFGGVNEDGNFFIGTEADWEDYEHLQEKYAMDMQGDLEEMAMDNYLDK